MLFDNTSTVHSLQKGIGRSTIWSTFGASTVKNKSAIPREIKAQCATLTKTLSKENSIDFQKLTFMLRAGSGNPALQTGETLLHIPQREYHRHMTRALLTLSHLACWLPLQPLHRECLWGSAQVSRTETFNTQRCPQTKKISLREMEWVRQNSQKIEVEKNESDEGISTYLCRTAMQQMWWNEWLNAFIEWFHLPLSDLAITSGLSSLAELCCCFWFHSPPKALENVAVRYQYFGQLTLPPRATAQQECQCVCACFKGRHIPILTHGLSQSVKGGG